MVEKGKNNKGKKTVYSPAPASYTNFRVGNTGNGGLGIGAGGEGNDPPERETDYSRTPPSDKNEFEENDDVNFQSPTDDEAEEQDAQSRSDRERSEDTRLTRDAVQGRRGERQLLDVVGVVETQSSGAALPRPASAIRNNGRSYPGPS